MTGLERMKFHWMDFLGEEGQKEIQLVFFSGHKFSESNCRQAKKLLYY